MDRAELAGAPGRRRGGRHGLLAAAQAEPPRNRTRSSTSPRTTSMPWPARTTSPPRKLSTIEEPPGIRSVRSLSASESPRSTTQGLVRASGRCCTRRSTPISPMTGAAGRFTPKHPLGLAGETLDKLHEAKEEAKKSGMYEKMQSGDPNDIFDSAEQLGQGLRRPVQDAQARSGSCRPTRC